jgi:hypothetical protein
MGRFHFHMDLLSLLQGKTRTFPVFITPATKHIKCHAGLDPASSPVLDSRFRGNDDFDIIVAGVIISLGLIKRLTNRQSHRSDGYYC